MSLDQSNYRFSSKCDEFVALNDVEHRDAPRIMKINRATASLALTFSVFVHCASAQPLENSSRSEENSLDRLPENCADHTNYPTGNSFTVVTARCGNHYEIWLTKSDVADPKAELKIVDRTNVARLKNGEIFVSGPFCYDKSGKEVFLSAVFRWHGKQKIQRGDKVIVSAWMPDTRRGRLVHASRSFITNIRCTISDDE
jgi:hypothetical protein